MCLCYLLLSLTCPSGTQRAISGLLLSFLYIEICATNAISSCSASVQCLCFSVTFSNVLYVVFCFWPEEKMFLVNVQDFTQNLYFADCKSGGLVGQIE